MDEIFEFEGYKVGDEVEIYNYTTWCEFAGGISPYDCGTQILPLPFKGVIEKMLKRYSTAEPRGYWVSACIGNYGFTLSDLIDKDLIVKIEEEVLPLCKSLSHTKLNQLLCKLK